MIDLNHALMSTATLLLGLSASSVASAQESPPRYVPRIAIAMDAGAAVPTGDLRDAFGSAFVLGAQGTYNVLSHLDVLADFDWSRPDTKLAVSDDHANVYQGDVGIEIGGARGSARRWAMRPFADVGAGFRRYDYASDELSDRTRPVGFAAIGTELAFGRSAIRLTARDNVLSFEAPTPDAMRSTRNDLGFTIGIGFQP